MILSQLEERLPALYFASCEDNGAVPYITSPPGRGKTSVIKQFPNIMKQIDPGGNYGLIVLNGACLNIGTMGGYLQFGPLVKGKPTSLFSLPHWWWTKEGKMMEDYDGGILFVDEADKMPPDESKTAGEAAYDKVWMTHKLSPGWAVWFAGNRVQDKAGSNKQFSHLINRQREIAIRDDTESWKTWAERAHLLPEVITFGEAYSQWLFQEMPKDLAPWCTPRTLHQAEIHLKALMRAYNDNKLPTDPTVQEELGGGIGPGAAKDLIRHIREGQDLPTYEQVMAAPKSAPVPVKPDGRRLMAYRIADRLTKPDVKGAMDYMDRYGDEFQAIFARMAIHKDYEFVFDPAFGEWCDKKAHLIALIERYKNASKH